MGLASELVRPDGLRVVTIESLRNAAQVDDKINGTTECHSASTEQATTCPESLKFPSPPGRNDLAVLLFTSGSTGPAKAVEFSNSQLIASVKMKSALHDIDSDMTFMSWVGECIQNKECVTILKPSHSV